MAASPANHQGGQRVFLIDDEQIILHSMRTLLVLWGYRVDTAASAREAEALFDAAGVPDLLIIDLRLGPDNGAELVQLRLPFRYWSTDFAGGEMVNVTSNGVISLDGMRDVALDVALPSPMAPNAAIAALWGDNQNRAAQCVVTLGAIPERLQIFQWNDSFFCCDDDPAMHATYEIVLHESGAIDMLYDRIEGGMTRTVGLENPAGTMGISGCADGTSYACVPSSGYRVRFEPAL